MSTYEQMHFRIIKFVHETLYGLFVNPYPRLRAAGITQGQNVLEVGCGPGFFTIPAAETVGPNGHVYALDINTAAVQYVRGNISKRGVKNVEVISADASKTGLPDASVDVAFLFGVVHALNDMKGVLQEMHRVLKDTGLLAVQSSRWPEDRLLKTFTKDGLFHLVETKGKVCRFGKDFPILACDLATREVRAIAAERQEAR